MKVLIYGDSLVSGLDLPHHTVTLESYPGYMLSELVALEDQKIGLSMVLSEDTYDAVVLMAGTNDWSKGQTVEEIVTDLQTLKQCIVKHQRHKIPKLIIMSIPHFPHNSALTTLEDETSCVLYCDFFEYLDKSMLQLDTVHLNAYGQSLLTEYLEDILSDSNFDKEYDESETLLSF
jgi:lysophospholipase L1-like esterase